MEAGSELRELVDLRFVDKVRSGSPVLSKRRKDDAEENLQLEEHQKLSFDPWTTKPVLRDARSVFVERQWLAFKTLQPETNLMIGSAPSWRPEETSATRIRDCPRWTRLWRSSGDQIDWQEDTWWLLEHAFKNDREPDFIGSAQTLKELFTLPYTDKPVSLLVYRVGTSVFVGSCSENLSSARFQESLQTEERTAGQVLHWVVHHGNWDGEDTLEGCGSSGVDPEERHRNELLRRFFYYTLSESEESQDAAKKNRNDICEGSETNGDNGSREPVPRFRRTLCWKFDEMEIVVGSNLVLFKDEGNNPLSAQLHDVSQLLSDRMCLDFYLENRLAGVPKLALCLHQGGLVRDYRIYETNDIPTLSGHHTLYEDNRKLTRAAFSPKMLEQKAAQLLHFLKERLASGEAYWLFKGQNSNVIHLCEMENASSLNRYARERWMYTMAMLCYRVALQYAGKRKAMLKQLDQSNSASDSSKNQTKRFSSKKKGKQAPSTKASDTTSALAQVVFCLGRERELLMKALELLQEILAGGGPPRLVLQAKLNEEVAETYIVEAELIQQQLSESWKESQQVHPESQLTLKFRYALAHWHYVMNCLWAYRSACAEQSFSDHQKQQEEKPNNASGNGNNDSQEGGGHQDEEDNNDGEDDEDESYHREKSSPEAEEALLEIESRFQRRVFHCFLCAAYEQQRVGNLNKTLDTVCQGLLCQGTFDQWKADWAKSHSLEDVAGAFHLIGDVLVEMSKRAIHSANIGPNQRSAKTWADYARSMHAKLTELFNKLELSREVVFAVMPGHLQEDRKAGNIVAAESISLLATASYGVSSSLYDMWCAQPLKEKSDRIQMLNRRAKWKLGNAWNEIGKLRVANGAWTEGKAAYMIAVEHFKVACDSENAALVLLNLNHMFRSIAMSCGSDKSKTPKELIETQRMYINEGTEFLQQAIALPFEGNKEWIGRLKLEEAMNHFSLGVVYRTVCKGSITQADSSLSRSLVADSSRRAISHLNLALQIYESYRGHMRVAKEKAFAVHYHLGSHLAWVNTEQEAFGAEDLLTIRSEHSTVQKLAKRHFALAVKGLTGPAADQCEREMKEFLASLRPKAR